MWKKRVVSFVLLISILFPCVSTCGFAKAKGKEPAEDIYMVDDYKAIMRTRYGLIANNVSEVYIGTQPDEWQVYIRQKERVKEIPLTEKKRGKYKKYTVAFNCKNIYPQPDGNITVDTNNRVLFTNICICGFFVKHTSKKQCKEAYNQKYPYINQVVETDVEKTWGNNNMFAYVKNNTLYITGSIMGELVRKTGDGCYKYDTVRAFFEGRGNQVQQVVCCEDFASGCNIFVLMQDGSVWGIGRNNRKLISNSKKKNYPQFVKIIDGGVKQIAACINNVAVVKKNNTLWTWGRTLQSKKKRYSATPRKIASNVKEVAVSTAGSMPIRSIIVYLKKNHKAYGIGNNYNGQGYAFTNRYKKGWHSKPVLLMKNVKHVYAATDSTLMLTRKNNLYWSGAQGWYLGCYNIKE